MAADRVSLDRQGATPSSIVHTPRVVTPTVKLSRSFV